LLYLLFVGQLGVMLRPLGTFGWLTAAAYPLVMGFFVAVFAYSLYLTIVRRRVIWRGRSISLPTTAPKP
jgi:4,4'-diaponeurosporenoate glycosyltransferase